MHDRDIRNVDGPVHGLTAEKTALRGFYMIDQRQPLSLVSRSLREKSLSESRRAQLMREAVSSLVDYQRFGVDSDLSIGEIARIGRTLRKIQA